MNWQGVGRHGLVFTGGLRMAQVIALEMEMKDFEDVQVLAIGSCMPGGRMFQSSRLQPAWITSFGLVITGQITSFQLASRWEAIATLQVAPPEGSQ